MTSALLEKYPNMTLLHLFKPGYKPMSKSISMDISVSHLYRKKNPRAKRASGGITLLIKLHDIFVCSVYLPPYTSTTQLSGKNNDRLDCFITFQNQLLEFSRKRKIILICGDFNARTGHLGDFAEDFSWDSAGCIVEVSVSDHIKQRNNKDHKVNKFGLQSSAMVSNCEFLTVKLKVTG